MFLWYVVIILVLPVSMAGRSFYEKCHLVKYAFSQNILALSQCQPLDMTLSQFQLHEGSPSYILSDSPQKLLALSQCHPPKYAAITVSPSEENITDKTQSVRCRKPVAPRDPDKAQPRPQATDQESKPRERSTCHACSAVQIANSTRFFDTMHATPGPGPPLLF